VFDVRGRRIRTLVDETLSAGEHARGWDGTNQRGEPVASGVYFYRLTAGDFRQTRRMLLLK
jgi:flagellar hook assembly protein FlgD